MNGCNHLPGNVTVIRSKHNGQAWNCSLCGDAEHSARYCPNNKSTSENRPAFRRTPRWPLTRRNGINSPPLALAQYLDLKGDEKRKRYWNDIKLATPVNSLPAIVIHQLHLSSVPEDDWDDLDHMLRRNALEYLHGRGFVIEDAIHWAWILSAHRSDEIVDRFLSKASEHPTFLLLQVLRTEIYHVENLKKLLLYIWKYVLGTSNQFEAQKCASHIGNEMEENAFTVMISRLLSQARRIWPSAIVSIARIVSAFVDSLVTRKDQDPENLDPAIHARICRLNNYLLPLLALPASIRPLDSMAYNWSAQKILLELAGLYNPPLLLDQASYRAVIRVHAASRKTARESKVATLRLRSWPPWRTEQDGMDAQRSPDDDLSKVMLAASRSNEAGYRETPFDMAMKILGGQEQDGTPTIQVRKVVKWRAERPGKPHADLDRSLDPGMWAARIEATRDVREAWRAFAAFRDGGGTPNANIYLAMFKKLNFELAREGRETRYEAVPGDGMEVLPVPDDNMSDFYKSHMQPPTSEALYRHMLSSGVVPSGRILRFLVQHARTPARGVEYLRDSGLNSEALDYLTGGRNAFILPKKPPDVLKKVPGPTLGAYIELICRFAPRAVLTLSERSDTYRLSLVTAEIAESETLLVASSPRKWCIQEVERSPFPRLRDPLYHATRLLKEMQLKSRPAWYSLFKALSRRNVVVSRKHIGGPKNDELAWSSTRIALRNFHECGLELDPHGFILICNSFFKFGEAAHDVVSDDYEAALTEGAQLLKEEFAKLSRSEESPYLIPRLLHNIQSVTLHIYVRCMGLVGDLNEIISVLDWMVQNRKGLEEIDRQSANGAKMLTRTLVAARISCYGTEFEERAAGLVAQVEHWQWPDDSELDKYSRSDTRVEVDGAPLGESS
ncbi:hypothetical protein MBM_06770 [Drepanopeziza brunnea f. sp. 'multigermtubi' MB_m1]|uniref:Uncharacterized protein n=1 Tax=Marssonina brunnea f. sp. multigermtubi (strain MB_m1) TaxID=1072389 RepID=K1XQX7_MARBU|nr:uncharacterized protein MBM_06770 [Drepanopeziza brunnea f. sp. 'multigermtubi' MB_m1]EKD15009.1 hypothetical protein MBM_06770 [Drepanopeziza brunnea f. sp. 'multigermtubi' MB_m1]